MDVAIPFKNHYKLNDKVQEFNISFDKDSNSFDKLIEFVREYEDKTINIEYKNRLDTKSALALNKIADNVRFRLTQEDLRSIPTLKQKWCHFFLDSTLPCGSWDELVSQVEDFGVSQVYPIGDLCFELDAVRRYCDRHHVRTRFVVNRLPSFGIVQEDKYDYAIYRPQDMAVLDKYIDVAEFDCGNDYKILSVLYKNYIETGYWHGQLGEINKDFAAYDLPCPSLMPRLAAKRSVCGHKCLKGAACNTCALLIESARILRDDGARIA